MASVGGTAIMSVILLVFIMHIVLLAIQVVLTLYLTIFKFYAESKNDEALLKVLKKYMNYIAITYASQQVFLTASTVFTLSYYPEFLIIAGKTLFLPLVYFVFAYSFFIGSVSLIWYGWGKYPTWLTNTFAVLGSLSGVLTVYFYSVVVGFLNYPKGLVSLNPIKTNDAQLFQNPTTYSVFFLLVFAAITVTSGLLILVHLIRLRNNIGDENVNTMLLQIYTWVTSVSGVLFLFPLVWYLLDLKTYSPYKYNKMVGPLGSGAQGANFFWLFLIFTVLLVFYVITIILGFTSVALKKRTDKESLVSCRALYAMGPLGALAFVALFLLNLVSQTPYFVADPDLAKNVPALNINDGLNAFADAIDLYSVTLFVVIPFILMVFYLIYLFFIGVVAGEAPREGKRLAGVIVKK